MRGGGVGCPGRESVPNPATRGRVYEACGRSNGACNSDVATAASASACSEKAQYAAMMSNKTLVTAENIEKKCTSVDRSVSSFCSASARFGKVLETRSETSAFLSGGDEALMRRIR